MKQNKLLIYGECETCKNIADTLSLETVEKIRAILNVERQRLFYEQSRLKTDGIENEDLAEGKTARYSNRIDEVTELENMLYMYARILEEG